MNYELKLYKGWEGIVRNKKDRVPDRFLPLTKVNRIKKLVDAAEVGITEKYSQTYVVEV